jgi:hypothetical protein
MESIILDESAELPGAEYQRLLEFESEIQDEGKFANVDFLTKEIKRGFWDYVRQGIMLHTIRRFRLYKEKFKDFKTYCEQGLGRQHFYFKQIIKAADSRFQRCCTLKNSIAPVRIWVVNALGRFVGYVRVFVALGDCESNRN